MATPECVEVDIDTIIEKVMEENNISPEKVPKEEPFDVDIFIENLKKKENWSNRYFRGHALGKFECDGAICDHKWFSAYAWCILDLKEQKMIKKFRQNCSPKHHKDIEQLQIGEVPQSASEPVNDVRVGVKPRYFDEDAARRMVEWAVGLFMELMGIKKREKADHDRSYRPTPEHHREECEMCQRLGKLCFDRL